MNKIQHSCVSLTFICDIDPLNPDEPGLDMVFHKHAPFVHIVVFYAMYDRVIETHTHI